MKFICSFPHTWKMKIKIKLKHVRDFLPLSMCTWRLFSKEKLHYRNVSIVAEAPRLAYSIQLPLMLPATKYIFSPHTGEKLREANNSFPNQHRCNVYCFKPNPIFDHNSASVLVGALYCLFYWSCCCCCCRIFRLFVVALENYLRDHQLREYIWNKTSPFVVINADDLTLSP